MPADIPKLTNAELLTSSNNTSKAQHSRNLSAHFYDATNLSDSPLGDDYSSQKSSANDELQVSSDSDSDKGNNSTNMNDSNRNDINNNSTGGSTHCSPLPQASPTVGQKHRRVFSGGVTNPVVAHRRINSGGNTAVINRGGKSGYRRSPRMSPNTSLRMSPSLSSSRHRFSAGHRREDSAGLDMLSAAADVSKQELADAAGVPPPPPQSRRSPPSSSGHGSHRYVMSPMSFSSLGSASPSQYAYHYARGGHPSSHNDPKHYQQPPHHYCHPPPPPSHYPAPRGYPMQYAPPKGPPPPQLLGILTVTIEGPPRLFLHPPSLDILRPHLDAVVLAPYMYRASRLRKVKISTQEHTASRCHHRPAQVRRLEAKLL